MAFGHATGHDRRAMQNGLGKALKPGSGFKSGISKPKYSSPASFGTPIMPSSPMTMRIGNSAGRMVSRSAGGGLVGSLLGNAVSAGVGVASAAIVNKIHENSQIKLQEKQAEQQAELERQRLEQQAEIARKQAEYQLEIEKLKVQQEEVKLDAVQDKRYYANCPYCMGVNNGDKFCRYCGSSLAYYDEDEEAETDKKEEAESSENI